MITLFTPTYNRAHLLDRLYESVLRQTDKNFEWIIVDDGSSDATGEKVNEWIKERKINIRYIYQKNSGKAAAFNKGVSMANGEVLCCVDSDDMLTDNAVEIIDRHLTDIQSDNIAGMIALKSDLTGKLIGNKFPSSLKYESPYNLNDVYNCRGDWSQIYKVSVLKKYPYPIIDGERFITESVLFDKLSMSYKALLVNEVVNYCEYQSEGLSKNIYSCMINNPTGYQIYYAQRIDLAYGFRKRIKYIIRYHAFRCMSKNDEYSYSGKHKAFVKSLSFLGLAGKIYYMKFRKKASDKK